MIAHAENTLAVRLLIAAGLILTRPPGILDGPAFDRGLATAARLCAFARAALLTRTAATTTAALATRALASLATGTLAALRTLGPLTRRLRLCAGPGSDLGLGRHCDRCLDHLACGRSFDSIGDDGAALWPR